MLPNKTFRNTFAHCIGFLWLLEVRHHLTGGFVNVLWGDWYTSWEVHNSRSSTGPGIMKKIRIEQIVATLPEIVDVNDQIERLHLLGKIEQAEKQLVRGEGVPHETSKQRLSQWLQ